MTVKETREPRPDEIEESQSIMQDDDLPQFNLEPIAALDRIPIHENNEPMVDLREFCPGIVVSDQVHYPFMRRHVAEMLNHAQSLLPEGIKLYVSGGYSCYRPLEQQARGYWRGYKRLKEEHPNWPESAIRRQLNRMSHPPDAKTPPGHSTGAAIDIGLIDAEGNQLDMWSPAPGLKPAQQKRLADTYSPKVSPEAHANRMILLRAMARAGFSNCTAEFWHYSWGDSGWAVRVGEKIAVYGPADKIGDPNLAEWVRKSDEEWAKREAEELAQRASAFRTNPYPPETTASFAEKLRSGQAEALVDQQTEAQKQALLDAIHNKDYDALQALAVDERLPRQARSPLSRITPEALQDTTQLERNLRWTNWTLDEQKPGLAKALTE